MRPMRTLNYGLHGAEVETGYPVMSIWLTGVAALPNLHLAFQLWVEWRMMLFAPHHIQIIIATVPGF